MVTILPLLKPVRQGDNRYMFAIYCSGHQSRVLLFSEHIDELVNGPDGVLLRWRCTCGTTGTTHIPRDHADLQEVA
jgi:hypothetical protein